MRALRLVTVLALCVVVSACGWAGDDGTVIVDNRSDAGTSPDSAVAFRLAAFGEPFTGNLLPAPLLPGSAVNLGQWHEDYYDAEADLALGGLVEWFDVWIHAETDNFFDIY
ncbi:MAG: hypothetical protein ACKOCB_00790 [Planctomycetia bacterium]